MNLAKAAIEISAKTSQYNTAYPSVLMIRISCMKVPYICAVLYCVCSFMILLFSLMYLEGMSMLLHAPPKENRKGRLH